MKLNKQLKSSCNKLQCGNNHLRVIPSSNAPKPLQTNLQSFSDHLLYAIIQQGSVFVAIRHANEINRINGYKVVTDYDIKTIKKHFRNNPENKSGNRQRQNPENKSIPLQREDIPFHEYQKLEIVKESLSGLIQGKNKSYEEQKVKSISRELQKGYMSMLSV